MSSRRSTRCHSPCSRENTWSPEKNESEKHLHLPARLLGSCGGVLRCPCVRESSHAHHRPLRSFTSPIPLSLPPHLRPLVSLFSPFPVRRRRRRHRRLTLITIGSEASRASETNEDPGSGPPQHLSSSQLGLIVLQAVVKLDHVCVYYLPTQLSRWFLKHYYYSPVLYPKQSVPCVTPRT